MSNGPSRIRQSISGRSGWTTAGSACIGGLTPYGTWHYQILAFDEGANDFVQTAGLSGSGVWQFIMYGDDDFINGETDLILPSASKYSLFIRGVAWDGETLGEFAMTQINLLN